MSIESEEFINFSSKINEFISAHMLAMDLNVNTYDFNYIWEEVVSKGVQIRPFPFEKSARRSISGMIVKDEFEITLAYNSNMSKKRINFTISHELVHFLYHLNNDNKIFTDTKETLNYSFSDLLPEFQANIGASAILLPEPVLINELKLKEAPYNISNKYGISESALFIRLIQLMQGNFEASYDAARKTASKIMSGHSKNTAKELGNNLENKILYTNPFYEALCV